MAKYKLTKVSYYEDNEQAGDDNYNQQYVQGIADTEVAYWNRCEAELQVNDGKTYKAVADGGPTDNPERRTKWPWVLASEMLPPGDEFPCIIAIMEHWEKATYHKTGGGDDESKPYFWVDDNLGGYEIKEKDFPQLWWRDIELPEEMSVNEK